MKNFSSLLLNNIKGGDKLALSLCDSRNKIIDKGDITYEFEFYKSFSSKNGHYSEKFPYGN